MKKITLVLSALLLCTVINAQQLVATLVHEGNVRIFYGANSFVDAHNAAVSGDVINLSVGLFNSCNITKNITLRGAGWKGAGASTTINGIVRLRIPSNDTVSRLYIEGISFRNYLYVDSVLNAPSIVRCRINYLYVSNSFNGSMVNCVVDGNLNDITYSNPANITFVNSILYGLSTYFGYEVINSIVVGSASTNYNYTNFTNCIFSGSSNTLQSGCSAYNCVYCGGYTNFFARV